MFTYCRTYIIKLGNQNKKIFLITLPSILLGAMMTDVDWGKEQKKKDHKTIKRQRKTIILRMETINAFIKFICL